MTLKELQKMIKEEFEAFRNEAEDEVDVSVSDNDIDAEMGDEEMAPEGEEDVLRKIYDLLAAHFEGEGEGEEEMDDDIEDVEGGEDEERTKKEPKKLNHCSNKIYYSVKPGDFVFFNSFMPHSYQHHKGREKFRFVHFNMTTALDAVQNIEDKENK